MKRQITANKEGERLDVFLSAELGLTRSRIKSLIDEKCVLLNGKVQKAGAVLKHGDKIDIAFEDEEEIEAKPENIPLDIVYEDQDVAVINKPQGLVVHVGNGVKSGTLVNALLYSLKSLSSINGKLRPGIVHRLDKNTSGLMVVAKNDKAHLSLSKQLEDKTCHRWYIALLEGSVKEDGGEIVTNIARDKKNRTLMAVCGANEGRRAVSLFKVIKRYEGFTLVEFELKTGRTHQIRVHAKYVLKRPIAGDKEYNPHSRLGTQGQYLHAYKLEFVHPTTGALMSFTAPLPEKFEDTLKKLKET